MAAPQSEKKKKSAPAKKLAPHLKKKVIKKNKIKQIKKGKTLKRPVKKFIKKPAKPPARHAEKVKTPTPKDENAVTRRQLLDMREKVLAEISENLIPESLQATSDIGDVVDQAGDERDRELSLLLTGRDKEKLQAINEALEKLNEGSYGTCEECGEKIGPGRLKVMPLAKFCVSCQSKLEKEVSLQRKAEEEIKYRGLAFASGMEDEEA